MKKLSLWLLIALSIIFLTDLTAKQFVDSAETTLSISNLSSEKTSGVSTYKCSGCNNCNINKDKGIELPFKEFPFYLFVLAVLIILFFKKNKLKVLFWALGLACLIGLSFTASARYFDVDNDYSIQDKSNLIAESVDDFKKDIQGKSYEEKGGNANDEFLPLEEDELTDNHTEDEEFLPLEESDEFEALDDSEEFESFESDEFSGIEGSTEELTPWLKTSDGKVFIRTISALFLVVIAGFAFRYSSGRKLRTVFLLISLIYFGFYTSGCPCMISSFQSFILLLLGEKVVWVSILWFAGLLILSYFFGKIWCGWVCHLGAFQEFLYKPGKLKIVLKPGVQKAIKIVRVIALIGLVAQLFYTRTNLYIKVDPFKVAFNMFSTNLTGYILLAILIISSFFIYRPFCRTFCPVGLLMGWVSYIPGASALQIDSDCRDCKRCEKQCDYQAINLSVESCLLNNSECIRCGDCIDTCKFKAISSTCENPKG